MSEKKKRCDVCGKMFDAKNIEQHKRDAHGQRCDVCGKMFDAKNIEQHKRDAHGQKKEFMKLSKVKLSRWIIIGGIIAAVIAGGAYWASIPSTSLANPLVKEGIRCQTSEALAYHHHVHLDIFISGQPYTIPANTGIIPDRCLFWLHIHDNSGVIHIESPLSRTFTLGQFFSIWGKTFNDTQIFDNVISENKTLKVYVNGKGVAGDYRDIELNQHDEVVIVYGAPPATIPSSYSFRQGE